MTLAQLKLWIEQPRMLDKGTLRELSNTLKLYPYFQSLYLLYLKNLYLLHDTSFSTELRKNVIYAADSRALFYLIESEQYTLKPDKGLSPAIQQVEKEPGIDRTLALIDAFLATMPEEQTSKDMPLEYASDYIGYLMQEDENGTDRKTTDTPKLRGQELIDGFIRKHETEDELTDIKKETTQQKQIEATESVHPLSADINGITSVHSQTDSPYEKKDDITNAVLDDSYFTETLAKIYIKQQRYEKALEILKKLSLNYPKKSTYFADQISTLEKLIINTNSK